MQARFTFSHNKISVQRDFTLFGKYLADAISRGGESATLIRDAQNILAANEGVEAVTGTRSSENLINWTVDYQFPRDSWLKGTRAAVYGNWRDKYNLTLLNDVMYRGGATHPVGAYLMHQRKVFGRSTSFRVGFRNILDLENSDDMRITGVREVDANGRPTNYVYRYVTPFSADFSITMEF